MWKKSAAKIRGSLTVRIFLVTVLILMAASTATFGFIALATPATYVTMVADSLTVHVDELRAQLAQTDFDSSGPILDAFIRSTADVMVLEPDGTVADTPSELAVKAVYEDDRMVVVTSQSSDATIQISDEEDSSVSVTSYSVESSSLSYPFEFPDREGEYTLCVIPRIYGSNQVLSALGKVLPWLLLVILAFSLLCAWGYSRWITRPILRISAISRKMAELDFTWTCSETRGDEIGQLGSSLDALSLRLSSALSELREANAALQADIDRERELEGQRTAFFSAASHELKTPITILKGQLAGMLAGVDVYRDRDKYLAKSLAVTGRMEELVREILAVSHMEQADFVLKEGPVDLSALIEGQAALLADLTGQRDQTLEVSVAAGLSCTGDAALLERAAANLLNNASTHSPPGAKVSVTLAQGSSGPVLTVENTQAAIPEEDLPHLFDAFFRVDPSRSRTTGGSGLGLYLVKLILDRHGAVCKIKNTPEGVASVVEF